MNRIARLWLLIVLVPFVAAQSARDAKTLAITHVTVIDVAGGPPKPDMTVTVHGGRIAAISESSGKLPKETLVVDGHGKFLIPGLWDMHVHTNFGDWLPGGKELILPLFVANGVTGVRDMGGDLQLLKEWRTQIDVGTIVGPRMVISGPMIDGAPPHFPASVPVTTASEGRKAVDDLKLGGADFIKVQSYIPRDAYFAVADESKKQGNVRWACSRRHSRLRGQQCRAEEYRALHRHLRRLLDHRGRIIKRAQRAAARGRKLQRAEVRGAHRAAGEKRNVAGAHALLGTRPVADR